VNKPSGPARRRLDRPGQPGRLRPAHPHHRPEFRTAAGM